MPPKVVPDLQRASSLLTEAVTFYFTKIYHQSDLPMQFGREDQDNADDTPTLQPTTKKHLGSWSAKVGGLPLSYLLEMYWVK